MFESSKVLEDCAKDRESGGNPSTKSTTTPQSSTPLGATSTTSGATPPPQSANSDRPFTDSVVSRDDETDRNEGNSCREEGERRVDGDDMLGKSPPWRPTARELSADERAEAKEAFVMFDLEATGKLRLRPLKMAFRALGIKTLNCQLSVCRRTGQMTKAQVAELMEEVAGQEREGRVTRGQFVDMFPLVVALRDVRRELCKAFHLFDEEKTGDISFTNIKRVVTETGEQLSDAEIGEMIDGIDRNADGVIRRHEFEAAMGTKGVGDPIDDLDSD